MKEYQSNFQSESGLIRIHGILGLRIIFKQFSTNENEYLFWMGLHWFGLIRTPSNTDFGIIRNSSDWFGMISYPKFSLGRNAKYLLSF